MTGPASALASAPRSCTSRSHGSGTRACGSCREAVLAPRGEEFAILILPLVAPVAPHDRAVAHVDHEHGDVQRVVAVERADDIPGARGLRDGPLHLAVAAARPGVQVAPAQSHLAADLVGQAQAGHSGHCWALAGCRAVGCLLQMCTAMASTCRPSVRCGPRPIESHRSFTGHRTTAPSMSTMARSAYSRASAIDIIGYSTVILPGG